MRFYNREKELKLLEKVARGKGTKFVIIKGLRRIGKTRTVFEFLKNKNNYAYIFVPKDKSKDLFLEEISQDLNIPKFFNLKDFFRYIFEKYNIVFLDEFQNFYYVDSSAYSELQRIIDEFRRKGKNLLLIVSGSSYSLMNKIFSEYSKALYGRRDLEITLYELPIEASISILRDIGFKKREEQIAVWSIFGGIPKFYETLYNLGISSFSEFLEIFFKENFKLLLDEGSAILKSEFGGEYKSFYTVMEAISLGKTKLNEIAAFFSNDLNKANRYISLLVKDYGLVKRSYPVIKSRQAKESRYEIRNNFFNFWFRFVKRYEYYYEQGNVKAILEAFNKDFNSYLGRMFEKFCFEIIRSKFSFSLVGKQWGKIPKTKKVYEIDILALNEPTREILFAECKWKDKVNPEKICQELSEKAEYVGWYNEERKESFAIFAKSFSKKIKEFEGKKVYCFDLKDLERCLKLPQHQQPITF